MSNGLRILATLLAAAFCVAACGQQDKTNAPAPQDADHVADAGEKADDSAFDVWLETLELGSRELYSAREAVVAAIGLKAGDRIADIGAGTGLYTLLFADSIGEGGVVYAVDIEPRFLSLINRRATDADRKNIVSVLSRENSVTLPDQSTDIIFVADTYHYFEQPQILLETIYSALKPGGRLVIIDYDLADGVDAPEGFEHVRFGKADLIGEIEALGFEFVEEKVVAGLQENYFVVLRRPIDG